MSRASDLRRLARQAGQAALRLIAATVAVTLVTALDFQVLQVNAATAGFTYLVLILIIATTAGLHESIFASLLCVLAYNYYFLPPLFGFTISDAQNWVALLTFLLTAIIASHLSSKAQRRAEEARDRQAELQRMYDFSRGLMLGNEDLRLDSQIASQLADSFALDAAAFYSCSTGRLTNAGNRAAGLDEALMKETAQTGASWIRADELPVVLPVRLGGTILGSIGVAGPRIPSALALDAIVQLVAIAIERARSQAEAARLEATQQNQQLKSTLLDALAHEFKTPLTSVKAVTSTLLSSALDREHEKELLSIIDVETDRLNRLVSDSIELARIDAGPIVLHRGWWPAELLIRSAIAHIGNLLESRPLDLRLADHLPEICVDRSLTELAIRQILTNAVKYSPADATVTVRAAVDNEMLVIMVEDRGAGIRKSDRTKIFERFYRAPEARAGVPGTGIGLGIARDIMRTQGGDISLASSHGTGATFSLTFPLSLDPNAAAPKRTNQ